MIKLSRLPNGRQEKSASPEPVETNQFEEATSLILGSLGQAAFTIDASGKVHYLNAEAEELTGWSRSEAVGLSVSDVIKMVHSGNAAVLQHPVERVLLERRTIRIPTDTSIIRRDGTRLAVEGSAGPILDRSGRMLGIALVVHDVSRFRDMAVKLMYQANHDVLTGLANRRVFQSLLGRALASARVQQTSHALCYIDLDQFKIINDSCGHGAGDELLCQVAKILRPRVRKGDTLARVGGDEFCLLLESCPLEQAEHIARDILEAIRSFRFSWNGASFTIGISIGITAITAASRDIASVLSASDAACYAAKEKGRNRIQVYGINDLELAERQREMRSVSAIREALDKNRFALFFQPVTPLSATPKRGEHLEILLRMRLLKIRLLRRASSFQPQNVTI